MDFVHYTPCHFCGGSVAMDGPQHVRLVKFERDNELVFYVGPGPRPPKLVMKHADVICWQIWQAAKRGDWGPDIQAKATSDIREGPALQVVR